jgi:hypothetical protein
MRSMVEDYIACFGVELLHCREVNRRGRRAGHVVAHLARAWKNCETAIPCHTWSCVSTNIIIRGYGYGYETPFSHNTDYVD